jgi:tetratricopeptide (TPR) repeat protein
MSTPGAACASKTESHSIIMRFTPHILLWSALLGAPSAAIQATPLVAAQDETSAEELIQRGRHFLDLRQPEAAQPFFQSALDLDDKSFESRLWLLRSWMDQGRSNDTLDALDDLRRAGNEGPQMEYLYGMAFLRRAQGMIAGGVTDSSPRMNFEDAVVRLGRTLEAFPERYPDAYQGVAVAAWFNQDLDRARWASEHAVKLSPKSPRAWLQLGRTAMSQFSSTRAAAEAKDWSSITRAHHARALSAFEHAIESLGQPLHDSDRQRLLSNAGVQLGHALIWAGRQAESLPAYTIGMSWWPAAVDYGQVQGFLHSAGTPASQVGMFHQALETASASYHKNFGYEDPRDAGMLWWLGWSRLKAGFPVGSEMAFLESNRKNPEFINCWFYTALARFEAQNFAGGADALAKGWSLDSNIMIDTIMADKETHIWALKQALKELVGKSKFANAATNRRAAMLSRMIAEADPNAGWNWNNLGMFLRDQADAMTYSGSHLATDSEILALHEKSYAAYLRSIELLPDDPGIVNDTAVLLHYYLERDLDKATSMYQRATQLAEKALLQEELGAWEKERLETALRDSIENLRLLQEKRTQPKEPDTSPTAKPGA